MFGIVLVCVVVCERYFRPFITDWDRRIVLCFLYDPVSAQSRVTRAVGKSVRTSRIFGRMPMDDFRRYFGLDNLVLIYLTAFAYFMVYVVLLYYCIYLYVLISVAVFGFVRVVFI